MLLEGDREERVRERLEQMLEEVSGAPELGLWGWIWKPRWEPA